MTTNFMRKHPVASISMFNIVIKELEALLPFRTENWRPIWRFFITGHDEKADAEDMLKAAKRSLDEMGVEPGDRRIIFFGEDCLKKDSFTDTITSLWREEPNNTLLVPICGPANDEKVAHALMFESFIGVPIWLIEISEQMRTDAFNMVQRLVGPESSAYTSFKIHDNDKIESAAMGWFSIFHLGTFNLNAIISLGGGEVTGNMARIFLAYKEQHDEEKLKVKWFVHLIKRLDAKPDDVDIGCDPFLFAFKEEMDSKMEKEKRQDAMMRA